MGEVLMWRCVCSYSATRRDSTNAWSSTFDFCNRTQFLRTPPAVACTYRCEHVVVAHARCIWMLKRRQLLRRGSSQYP